MKVLDIFVSINQKTDSLKLNNHLKPNKMSQLIIFICSLITLFVINSNTTTQELTQNEKICTPNWLHESCIKGNLLGEELPLNISKTKK